VDGGAAARSAGKEAAMGRSIHRVGVAFLVALALSILGCGSGPETTQNTAAPSGASEDAGYPATVSGAGGAVTLERRPERIISLSPTATEMLFAIGAGDQVVAVDDQSNHPPRAPRTDLSGYEPNVEAIAGYAPDLVVISNPGEVEPSLEALDIPVLLQPAADDLDGTYVQIEQLGELTGHRTEAEALVSSMRGDIDRLVEAVPEFGEPPTYYHELDQTLFTATSDTFIGQVYSLLGLSNIADQAKGASSGYPQLSAEFILQQDPDLVFLADTKCCGQSAQTVADRPGWDGLAAVRRGAVVELDDDVASRWGPRVVDFLRVVVDEVVALEPAAA
jgi:iron complex transport system substrate-binding protein